MTDEQQPEALRLADELESEGDSWFRERDAEAATELRRLHAENEDFRATIDHMTCENAGQIGEIVALKEQRDELLEALRDCMRRIDDGADYGPDHAVTKARAAITKAGGAA